jgi:exonuclease VII small subunit
MEKQIAALEEALEIWSNAWGNSVTEWGMQRAEKSIQKIQRQLAELKEENRS